ncbi:toxin ETX/toxin MTX2 [Bacillus sp. 5mfcol3.1]|uniref:ETX/MTX2 family pore-forming toxin n=1 Tax=Bacillus sp. 5mfcol3.1 TaxID=1761756 RepID=UPI0008E1642F|nr:ETX/MTX2 family pore-forming toxin [Bacillus sp. 5mfcol3.1]SFM27417.1 toxin ETX/toxin MTX2 [Bacillus sp. 5mfcol3.1]
MKKKTTAMKSILVMSTIVSLGTGLAVASPSVASANEIQRSTLNETSYIKSESAIQNVNTTIDDMLRTIPIPGIPELGQKPWSRTASIYGNSMDVSGVNINETNVTKVLPVFLGSNTFVNNTSQEQTYNTSTFSQAITNTTTTTTTHGFKESTAGKVKVGIPFIGETEITQTLEYNFTNSNANTKSETNTITAPAQPVKVPANKIYKTEVYFEKKQTSGNVELYADILTGAKNPKSSEIISIGSALDRANNKNGLTKSPTDPNRVRSKGNGTFTIEYGTNLVVKTYDITSGTRTTDSTTLVNTKVIPLH